MTFVNVAPRVRRVSALPAPSASYQGQLLLVPGDGATTPDIPYACLQSSSGSYAWKQLTTGDMPVGSVTVAVPASGVAVPAVPYDRNFYVNAAAAGTTTMSIGGGQAITVPAAGVVNIRVPRGLTVTPTYGGQAPTWVVEGE
jgi:hypothetical protein